MNVQSDFTQMHFELYGLVLPYCTVCTPPVDTDYGGPWHTPPTCQESSDAEYVLWFSKSEAPHGLTQPTNSIAGKSALNSSIFNVITKSQETTPKLKGGKGMASRGTLSLTMADFSGDPGPINVSEKGSFFGKLQVRNVLQNKKIRVFKYAVTDSKTTPQLVETSEYYIEDHQLSGGIFTIKAKDPLKNIEEFSEKFPKPTEEVLTAGINKSTTSIPVSDGKKYAIGDVIRIDKEPMLVNGVSGNTLTVETRGTTLTTSGQLITKSIAEEHSIEATVQVCYVAANKKLAAVLRDIFTSSGLSRFIDFAQWEKEIDEWNRLAILTGLLSQPEETDKILDRILSAYMVDMWFDQSTQKIKVSTVTVWKDSIRQFLEGADIDKIKIKRPDSIRFTRAAMVNTKEYQGESNETVNFSNVALATDTTIENSDFFGEPKVHTFDDTEFISKASAETVTRRFIQRFARGPREISFEAEERKLGGTELGHVVEIISRDMQAPDGRLKGERAQVVRIQPKTDGIGRKYLIDTLTYTPEFGGGDVVIRLTGNLSGVNLYSRAGSPPVAINATFIFDAATIGSAKEEIAVRAGAGWAPGSTITIICINNTKWAARGGDGGAAFARTSYRTSSPGWAAAGQDGEDSYVSDGVPTKIYLNYKDLPIVPGYPDLVAISTLFAAGGGGGGASFQVYRLISGVQNRRYYVCSGSGGSGGSGIPGGNGGVGSWDHQSGTVSLVKFHGGSQNGNNGSFDAGGNQDVLAINLATIGDDIIARSRGGINGSSVNASDAHTSGAHYDSVLDNARGAPGKAGGAFKGTNITVYNLAADAAKLRDGNSDSYTLVTV